MVFSRISIVGILTALPFELHIDCVECLLKAFVPIVDNCKTVTISIDIVDVETTLCGYTKLGGNCDSVLCHSLVFWKYKYIWFQTRRLLLSSKGANFLGFVDLRFSLVFVFFTKIKDISLWMFNKISYTKNINFWRPSC